MPDIAYNNQLKGITTLFLTDFKNNVTKQKMITWEQVNLSSEWDRSSRCPTSNSNN